MFEMVKFMNPCFLNFRSFEIADSVGGMGVWGGYTPPVDIVNLHCLGIDLDPMQLSDVAGWIPPLIQPNGLALHIEASNCQTYCCMHEPHGYSHFGSNIPAFVQAVA